MLLLWKKPVKHFNEVVVIGYGTVKKKDLTGAVAAVKGEELVNKRTAMLPMPCKDHFRE